MRRTSAHRLLNLCRLISLLGAASAASTWAVWVYAPDWVDSIDTRLRKRYMQQGQRPLQRAQELLARDPKAGIAALERFREQFAGYQQGDHYFRLRKSALRVLADAYRQRGDLESAESCWEEILRASPRDLIAAMKKFEVMFESEDRRPAAIAGLEALHAKIPESQQITDSLTSCLAKDGDFERAWQAQLETHESYRSSRWFIRWKRGEPELWKSGLSGLVSPSRAGNRMRLEFAIEQNIHAIRIGLPIHSNLEFRDMRMSLHDGESLIEAPLNPDNYTLHEMRQIGDTVRSYGTSLPWIEIPLDKLNLKRQSHFEFTAEIRELYASGMRSFAAAWMPQLIEMMTKNQDEAGLQALSKMRQTLLPESAFDIYWHDTSDNYSGERKRRISLNIDSDKDGIHFDVVVPMGVPLTAIRFDSPELIGLEIQFEEFSITEGGQVHQIDLDAIEYLRGMERNGNSVTATGPDPHMSIKLPLRIHADSVHLKGVAR